MTCDRCKFEIGYNEAYVTFPPAWAERDCRHEHLECYDNNRQSSNRIANEIQRAYDLRKR